MGRISGTSVTDMRISVPCITDSRVGAEKCPLARIERGEKQKERIVAKAKLGGWPWLIAGQGCCRQGLSIHWALNPRRIPQPRQSKV